MTIKQRIENYELEFGKWKDSIPHLSESEEKFYGMWVLGNDYKNKSPIKLYGSFPPNLLRRVMAFFPDKKEILHAFSGSLPKGDYTRIDINEKLEPDIICNIEELNLINVFDLVIVDPPYSRDDSLRYGFPYPNKKKCFNNLVDSLVKTGHLVWLDTSMPMYSNEKVKLIGIMGIVRSTNHRFRCLSFFEKR
jgi:hypothetical protein